MRARLLLGVLISLIVLILGCGGGGGGGGGGNNGGVIVSAITIEAVFSSNNQPVDPSSITVGDNIKFQAVGYDINNVRIIVGSTGWDTTDVGNQAGVLSSNGSYTAQNQSATTYTVSCTETLNNTTIFKNYQVLAATPRVSGKVVDTNGFAVPNIVVQFLDASNAVVGTATTNGTGVFTGSTTNAAVKAQIQSGSVNTTTHLQSFSYNGANFSPLVVGCGPSIGPISGNSIFSMPFNMVLYAKFNSGGGLNPPPPPPGGCN